ncbi:MAG: alpha/beta hydrolase [Gammaproteobacteria bacterium]
MVSGREDGLEPRYWIREDGSRIAYRSIGGRSPTVVFLGGFSSDMTGTKATHLDVWCRERGQAYLRFDYQGHGTSSGQFVDGTIGIWRDDALAVIEGCTEGSLILVGSSMGAWIMLLVAGALPGRVDGLVGLAAAPDFTEELIWRRLTAESRAELMRIGAIHVPSEFAVEGCPISLGLMEEGREHLLLGTRIAVECPVRLLHGADDSDVPWEMSRRLLEALNSPDVTLELVKGGDHRLSTPADLARLTRTLDELLEARS